MSSLSCADHPWTPSEAQESLFQCTYLNENSEAMQPFHSFTISPLYSMCIVIHISQQLANTPFILVYRIFYVQCTKFWSFNFVSPKIHFSYDSYCSVSDSSNNTDVNNITRLMLQ